MALVNAFKFIIQCGMDAPEFTLGTALFSAGLAIKLFKRLYY